MRPGLSRSLSARPSWPGEGYVVVTTTRPAALSEGDVDVRLEEPSSPEWSHLVWRASLCLLALQLIGMLVFSKVQYGRFNLTTDFASYSQVWTAIAHGHFDPYSTEWGVRFWRNDFEVLMWPLALFYWVYPHAVTLLWLQDVAVVAGEFVVLFWVRESLGKPGAAPAGAGPLLALATALVVVNPFSWFTIGFDFHMEPVATVFALLAARALFSGRHRQLLLWVPLTLGACAVPGALLVLAIGLVGLVGPRGRRSAALWTALGGAGWLVLVVEVGAARNANWNDMVVMYGYLTGQTSGHLSVFGAMGGLVTHPVRALDMLGSHAGYVAGYVASGGALGLASRWGLLPAAAVLLPSALNADPDFIHFAGAFQSWPAMLFLVVGSVLVVQRLAAEAASAGMVAKAFGAVTFAAAVGTTVGCVGQISLYLSRVSPAAAAKLALTAARVPSSSEVIASQGVIGRFGTGHRAYPYWASGSPEVFPLYRSARTVVFVLAPVQGTAEGYPAETRSAIRYVEAELGARRVIAGSGVWAFTWRPATSARYVVLP